MVGSTRRGERDSRGSSTKWVVPLRKGRSSRWRTCPHSLTERRVVREHRSGDGAVQAFEGVPLVGLAQGSACAPYAYARMDRRRCRAGVRYAYGFLITLESKWHLV